MPTQTSPRSTKSVSRRGRARPPWAELRDDQLLNWRLCDLGLKIEGTVLQERISQLGRELADRNLRIRPHFWLAEEWFSPDGVPGIAVPFYLAHPRLTRLEEKMMLEVEGGTRDWCMRILRHEAGHVLDTAFRLHHRRRWQQVFGRSSEPYPDFYHPKPYSKHYVLHLGSWYAQSHPAEDFAETFAVWLKPDSRWRSRYAGWPALKKLHFVDELTGELAGKRPLVRSRRQVDPLSRVRTTLGEYYQAKQAHYATDYPDDYDRDLRRLFTHTPRGAEHEAAAAFLRRNRPELLRTVAAWTGETEYTVDQVLAEMIGRCRQLKLRRDRPERRTRHDATMLLTVQTMNYLHQGHPKVAL